PKRRRCFDARALEAPLLVRNTCPKRPERVPGEIKTEYQKNCRQQVSPHHLHRVGHRNAQLTYIRFMRSLRNAHRTAVIAVQECVVDGPTCPLWTNAARNSISLGVPCFSAFPALRSRRLEALDQMFGAFLQRLKMRSVDVSFAGESIANLFQNIRKKIVVKMN